MDQVQQQQQKQQQTKLQVVAKKLEKMLETALQQLKLEQKMRKESDEKLKRLKDLETEKTGLVQRVMFLEAELGDRDARIIKLETKMAKENLLEEISSRDVELDRREEMIASLRQTVENLNEQRQKWERDEERQKNEESILTGVNAKVVQYEKRLSKLIENNENSADDTCQLEGFDDNLKPVLIVNQTNDKSNRAHKYDEIESKIGCSSKNRSKIVMIPPQYQQKSKENQVMQLTIQSKEKQVIKSTILESPIKTIKEKQVINSTMLVSPNKENQGKTSTIQCKENQVGKSTTLVHPSKQKIIRKSTVLVLPNYLTNTEQYKTPKLKEAEKEEVIEPFIKYEQLKIPNFELETFGCGKRKRLPNAKYKDAYQKPKTVKKEAKKTKEIDLDEVLNEEWDQSQSDDQPLGDEYDGENVKYENELIKMEDPDDNLNEDPYYIVGSTAKHSTCCKVCNARFQNRDFLTAHEKETGHDLRFACQYGCGKKFRQKIQCVRHEGQIHSSDMPFQCTRCQKKFKSEFSCKRHQENETIHEKMDNSVPFHKCDICGKEFDRKRRWCLDQHMLTHLASKPFPCEFCKKTFRQKSYLQVHKKFCIGIKEHECLYCGQRFAQKATLTNHQRRHTGEKPYKCGICNQGFRTHNLYLDHGRKVHGAVSAGQFHQLQDEAQDASEELQSVFIEEVEGGGDVVSTFKDDSGDTYTVTVVPPDSVDMEGETIAIAVDENGVMVEDCL